MTNASEITELFLFKAKHIPFMFGVLSRSLTKILEIMGESSQSGVKRMKESILEDKNLYVLIKQHSNNAHLGTRHTSCSLLQETRMERAYFR